MAGAYMGETPQGTAEAFERCKDEGVAQAKAGNFGAASESFTRALQFVPDDFKLVLDRGYALYYAKRYEAALQDAERARSSF